MNIPKLEQPARYQGLYVFDFGEWSAVGYTAEEIAVLLDSEAYREGKVYRIRRAAPNGQLELQGVSATRFQAEAGVFFFYQNLEACRDDFEALGQTADERRPPCRAKLQLATWNGEGIEAAIALIYPAEFDDDIASWLTRIGFQGGDVVEGGISAVTDYYQSARQILERRQLWGESSIPARSNEELFASVRQAVQR
jgi:hypothetical protein